MGAISRKTMATIALVVVIAASMIYNFSQFAGGPKVERVVTLGFTCEECKAEFTVTNEQLQAQEIDHAALKKHLTRTLDQPHCPKCAARHSGIAMLKCPSCEKFFLPAAVNVRRADLETRPPDPVCPHCGTDLYQWHREHLAD